MNFPEHLKGGIIGSIVVTAGFSLVTKDPDHLAGIFSCCLYGSQFIDLDTHSKPSQFTAFVLTIVGAWGLIMKEPYIPLFLTTSFCFVKIFRHRGWIHTFTVPLIAFFIAYRLQSFYFVAFGMGNIIHLSIDKIWPWKFSNWHDFRFKRWIK